MTDLRIISTCLKLWWDAEGGSRLCFLQPLTLSCFSVCLNHDDSLSDRYDLLPLSRRFPLVDLSHAIKESGKTPRRSFRT